MIEFGPRDDGRFRFIVVEGWMDFCRNLEEVARELAALVDSAPARAVGL